MDKDALTALKSSIEKWKKNSRVRDINNAKIGAENCPLCNLYLNTLKSCERCPVYSKTGKKYCENTPFDSIDYFSSILDSSEKLNSSQMKEFRKVAKQEVKFLESLLPKEENDANV